MTPNQFKENIMVDVRYKNGNDQIEPKTLKYNVSDLGRSIANENFNNPEGLRIPNPNEKDAPVSADYLIEVKDTIFTPYSLMRSLVRFAQESVIIENDIL